jgi:hypothetical protein
MNNMIRLYLKVTDSYVDNKDQPREHIWYVRPPAVHIGYDKIDYKDNNVLPIYHDFTIEAIHFAVDYLMLWDGGIKDEDAFMFRPAKPVTMGNMKREVYLHVEADPLIKKFLFAMFECQEGIQRASATIEAQHKIIGNFNDSYRAMGEAVAYKAEMLNPKTFIEKYEDSK